MYKYSVLQTPSRSKHWFPGAMLCVHSLSPEMPLALVFVYWQSKISESQSMVGGGKKRE